MAGITDAERVVTVTADRRRDIVEQNLMGVSQKALAARLGLSYRTIYAVIKHANNPNAFTDQTTPSEDWHGVISPGWGVHGSVGMSRRAA